MTDPLKLNQSQISQFMRCPEQWRRVNVEKERIPPAFAMHRGTAVHSGAELNFAQKIQSGEDLPRKDIVEVSVEKFKTAIKNEGVWLSPDELTVGKEKLQDEHERKVIAFSGIYAEEVAPKYQPKAVEIKAEVPIRDDGSLILHGRIDWVDIHDVIVDLKTGSASVWSQEAVDSSIQFTMYALLFTVIRGSNPFALMVELITDKKDPDLRTFVTSRGSGDFNALITQAVAVEKAIRSGSIFGAYGQKGAWWCSRKSCGFWSSCPFVPEHRR